MLHPYEPGSFVPLALVRSTVSRAEPAETSPLPHDLLIAFDSASLEELVLTSMSITDRPRPKLVMVQSALGRHLFAFVWLPRDEVSTGRRLAVESLLVREARAGVIGWTMVLEDGAITLPMLRQKIERWLAAAETATGT